MQSLIMEKIIHKSILGGIEVTPLQDPEKQNEVKKYYDHIAEVHKDYFEYWLDHTLWSWDFWLSVALAILPWLLWILVRKKESQGRLLHAGMFVIIIVSWLDFIGVVFGAWSYTGKVIPTIPSYIPWDFCLLPVSIMLALQFKPNIKPWIKGLIYAGLTAFVGEPIMTWLGLYMEQNWSMIYSFPVYFLIYLAADRVSKTNSFAKI